LAINTQLTTFEEQLAERPFDRALRAVFSDYLSERGDPRGEVIALSQKATLSLTERRRMNELTSLHAESWAGQAAPVLHLDQSRFEGGFLHRACTRSATETQWHNATGAHVFCTVQELVLPPNTSESQYPFIDLFLQSPSLKHVRFLSGSTQLWSRQIVPQFKLQTAGLVSYGFFGTESFPPESARLFHVAKHLECTTFELVNGRVALEIIASLVLSRFRHEHFESLTVYIQFGAVEGVFMLLARSRDVSPATRPFRVKFSEMCFEYVEDHLFIDLGAHFGSVGLGGRIGILSSVMVMLDPLKLKSIKLQFPANARLKSDEKSAIAAALRRLKTVETVQYVGLAE
jgi:uncharacterized protein (TIGR02996 family)